jgi:hypothetical protein
MADKGYSTIQLLDDDDESEEEVFDAKATNLKFTDFTSTSVPAEINTGAIKAETTMLNLQGSDDDNDDDKRELLSDRKSPSFWTFEYYQPFFDVDTEQVLSRMLGTMVPSRQNYLLTKIRPNPDLYGPFWICATLVFTIAICGNLSSFFASEGTHKWKSNFQLVSLSACVIYAYAWIVPATIWGYLLWRGNLAGYSFLEIVCVYGYSLAIFIPISILWIAPYDWLRWILVIIGVFSSGSVLAMTFWRAVEDDNRKYAITTIVVIIVLHFVLGLGFKQYFFKSIRIHAHDSVFTNHTMNYLIHR